MLRMRKSHHVRVSEPLTYAHTGLSGKRARVLVGEPTHEIDWPADLASGTKSVVILDDTPNPHHTLRVHPIDVALVVYDKLASEDDAG